MARKTVTLDTGSRSCLVSLSGPGASVPDGDGGWTTGEVPLDPPTARAAIRPADVGARERVAAGTVAGRAVHQVQMPYHPGVTLATRITYHGRILEIVDLANPEERNVVLDLICVEVVPQSGGIALEAP